MSYIRPAHPLRYFDDISKEYVFLSVGNYDSGLTTDMNDNKEFVEDYNTDYSHLPSFIELIGNIVERETHDKEYAFKIVSVLAKKLDVPMREKRLTDDEYEKILCDDYLEISKKLINFHSDSLPDINDVVKYDCGHETQGLLIDTKTTSLREYIDWAGTVGWCGDKSKCFKCYKGK